MRVGKLRHYVTIEEPPDGDEDEYGHVDESSDWDEVVQVFAEVEPISGREFWRQQQVQADVTHGVRIRWLDGITTQMRVDFEDRKFNIASVIKPSERNIELLLMCKEVV